MVSQAQGEGKNHLPQPAGYTLTNTFSSGMHCWCTHILMLELRIGTLRTFSCKASLFLASFCPAHHAAWSCSIPDTGLFIWLLFYSLRFLSAHFSSLCRWRQIAALSSSVLTMLPAWCYVQTHREPYAKVLHWDRSSSHWDVFTFCEQDVRSCKHKQFQIMSL